MGRPTPEDAYLRFLADRLAYLSARRDYLDAASRFADAPSLSAKHLQECVADLAAVHESLIQSTNAVQAAFAQTAISSPVLSGRLEMLVEQGVEATVWAFLETDTTKTGYRGLHVIGELDWLRVWSRGRRDIIFEGRVFSQPVGFEGVRYEESALAFGALPFGVWSKWFRTELPADYSAHPRSR